MGGFSVGGIGIGYMTKEKSADKISFYNLEELEAETKAEQRLNALAYEAVRAEEEKGTRKDARTHYKMLLTWDRKEETEKADVMAHKFLLSNFPQAKCVLATHQDTDHTHVHIWIDARQMDGKKIHIKKKEFESFHENWWKMHDAEYGTRFYEDFTKKKAETREWKKLKAQGIERPKPERVSDKFNKGEYYKKREIAEITGIKDEKGRDYRNQRDIESGNRRIEIDEKRDFRTQNNDVAEQQYKPDHLEIFGQATNFDDRQKAVKSEISEFAGENELRRRAETNNRETQFTDTGIGADEISFNLEFEILNPQQELMEEIFKKLQEKNIEISRFGLTMKPEEEEMAKIGLEKMADLALTESQEKLMKSYNVKNVSIKNQLEATAVLLDAKMTNGEVQDYVVKSAIRAVISAGSVDERKDFEIKSPLKEIGLDLS
jgi:hypothetical protein